jgi:hypothetical protein
VVGVQMREVDLLDLDQAERALELALRSLAAVEHQPLAPAGDEQAGGIAARRGHGAARAEECHGQVHGWQRRTAGSAGAGAAAPALD